MMQDELKQLADAAIREAGGGAALGRALKLNRQAIYQWCRVPSHHVLEVERITGLPRHRLRPDLYPSDRENAA